MDNQKKLEWISFGDEPPHMETPTPNKSTKFLSVEVDVLTHQGYGRGIYNFMDDDWLVELYDDPSDELQAYKGVTHWRPITYRTEEERLTFRLVKDTLRGFNLI